MNDLERFVDDTLSRLEEAGLLRSSELVLRRRAQAGAERGGRELLDAASNDYLGLTRTDVSRETLVQSHAAVGAGASRLIHGTHAEHLALERELADWTGFEASLLFATGYSANVGLAQALGGPSTVLVSDALNHASIIDGCRLTRARVEVVPHLSIESVERCLAEHRAADLRCVVTESYFSMDGDGPDLGALRAACDRQGAALVVDEAHSLGVFGPAGSGRCRAAGVVPDVLVGTLGKAVGAQGAFVASSPRLRELLWNRARSFVFSTAPSPLLCEVARFHVQRTRDAGVLRARLDERTAALRTALAGARISVVPGSFGPIVPVLIGDERRALAVVENLADAGILAQAIRAPTVPPNAARVRLTVKATWPDDAPHRIASTLADSLHS
ncbi:MAG TPA: 8-amino-7-oxononanoate synthase [Polyangiaceae bacterium]